VTAERASTIRERGAAHGGRRASVYLARDLMGRRVADASGRTVGNVIDVEIRPVRDGLRVVALDLGRHGWLDRLNIIRPLVRRLAGYADPLTISWQDVERFDEPAGVIRLRKKSR
jgi:sporulation protein YlmC with PRC-barrel domain